MTRKKQSKQETLAQVALGLARKPSWASVAIVVGVLEEHLHLSPAASPRVVWSRCETGNGTPHLRATRLGQTCPAELILLLANGNMKGEQGFTGFPLKQVRFTGGVR